MWRGKWVRPGGDTHAIDLPLRLTLVVLLCRPLDPWAISAGVMLLAVLGLVHVPTLRAPLLWLAVTVLAVVHLVVEWPFPDNHHYLLAYWTLGVGLALTLSAPPRALAATARLLIGMTFLLAVLWKALLSPEYRDGRFFAVTLLTDDRFEALVQLAGGLDADQLAQSREYLTPLPEGAELLHPRSLPDGVQFRTLVGLLTWGGLLLELTVAVLWLLPLDRPPTKAMRHATLIAFCMATYALAPVAGFGWLLLSMGVSATAPDQRRLRAAYVGAFGLVLLCAEVPWTSLLLDLRGRGY